MRIQVDYVDGAIDEIEPLPGEGLRAGWAGISARLRPSQAGPADDASAPTVEVVVTVRYAEDREVEREDGGRDRQRVMATADLPALACPVADDGLAGITVPDGPRAGRVRLGAALDLIGPRLGVARLTLDGLALWEAPGGEDELEADRDDAVGRLTAAINSLLEGDGNDPGEIDDLEDELDDLA